VNKNFKSKTISTNSIHFIQPMRKTETEEEEEILDYTKTIAKVNNYEDCYLIKDFIFMNACREGNIKIVKYFMRRGCSFDKENDKKVPTTPFMQACAFCHFEIVDYFVKQGANVNFKNSTSNLSPLLCSFQSYNPKIINYLLDNGANINSDGPYFVERSILNNDLETLKKLLKKNCSIKMSHYSLKKTNLFSLIFNGISGIACENSSLITAITTCNEAMVEYLLDNGASYDDVSEYGQSALELAIQKYSLPIVKLFVERGCPFHTENKSGINPFTYAATLGSIEVVKYFLEKGFNINTLSSKDGSTALIQICQYEELNEFDVSPYYQSLEPSVNVNVNMVKFLLENGADPDISTKKGNTAADVCFCSKSLGLLLCHMKTTKYADNPGRLISIAAYYGDVDLMRTLHCKGISITRNIGLSPKIYLDSYQSFPKLCEKNLNALSVACQRNHFGLCEFLLFMGFDANAEDESGLPPLRHAIKSKLQIIKILMVYGADIYVHHLNKSIFQCAQENMNKELLEFLLHNGCFSLEENRHLKDVWIEFFFNYGMVPHSKLDPDVYGSRLEFKMWDPQFQVKDVENLLHVSIIHNHFELFFEIIHKIIDVSKLDSNGNSILHLAIFHERLEIFHMILENFKYETFNTKNNRGLTPIEISMRKGSLHYFSKTLQLFVNPFELENSVIEHGKCHKVGREHFKKFKIQKCWTFDLNFQFQ
jgi:ankyrin repeat protein